MKLLEQDYLLIFYTIKNTKGRKHFAWHRQLKCEDVHCTHQYKTKVTYHCSVNLNYIRALYSIHYSLYERFSLVDKKHSYLQGNIPGKCYSPKMLPNGPMREHKSPRMWHARNGDRGHSLSIDNRTSSLWCMWCQRLRLSIRKKIRSIS